MIDIHSHLLPGIDDGSPDLVTSLGMAREAVEDGITHALMTPHHLNGRYVNVAGDVQQMTVDFQNNLRLAGIPLTVFPAQEVRLTGDLVASFEAGDLLTTDPDGKYMLIEFPSQDVPAFAPQMLFDLEQHGVAPIIVHPERNEQLMANPGMLYDLVAANGAYAQVTASSYVGVFGKAVQAFTEDILDAGLAQMIASDAHHIPGRGYDMAAAFKKLTQKYGPDVGDLFDENAKAVVNGDPIKRRTTRPIKKKKFFSAY
jgi:protein-tyrosine phosphatase